MRDLLFLTLADALLCVLVFQLFNSKFKRLLVTRHEHIDSEKDFMMYLHRLWLRIEPLDKPEADQRPVHVSTVLFSILKSHTNECAKVGCPCRDIEAELDGLAVDLVSHEGEHDIVSLHEERSVVSDD